MTSQLAAPTAAPTFKLGPDGVVTSAGEDAIDLAATAGLILDPWQRDDLIRALGERADGTWAAKQVAEIVARQNGKGSILEARVLAGLFLFEHEQDIVWSAHEFKTSGEAFRRLIGLIEDTPVLAQKVKRRLNNTTETSIELHDGSRVRFVARSSGSGRGLTGDLVILDEAYKLPSEVIAALVPTMNARPNSQLWFTSSAPLPIEASNALRRVCRRGRTGTPGRLAYAEYCVVAESLDDVDLDDVDNWRAANPGMETGRVTEESIQTCRDIMDDEEFAREILGVWFEDADEERARVLAKWPERRVDDDGVQKPPPTAVAWDVASNRSMSSVSLSDGDTVVVAEYGGGTSWVAGTVADLCVEHGLSRVACDRRSAAGTLVDDVVQALKERGLDVEVETATTAQVITACGLLFDAIEDDTVCHYGQEMLDDAVDGAVARDVGDAWLWDRRKSEAEISPLVAATLAYWAARTAPEPVQIATPVAAWA